MAIPEKTCALSRPANTIMDNNSRGDQNVMLLKTCIYAIVSRNKDINTHFEDFAPQYSSTFPTHTATV
jgi:hypothetical protein